MGTPIEHLADTLVENAWSNSELWEEFDQDEDGRPTGGKDIEAAKRNLAAALDAAYVDWLEGENSSG